MTSPSVLSRSVLGDIALAFAIFIAALFASGGNQAAWLYGLIVVGTLSLALRRRFAVPVLVIVAAITAFAQVQYDSWWPFAALIAFYSVGAHCARRTAIVAGTAGLLLLGTAAAFEIDWNPLGWDDLALMTGRLAPIVAAWVLGENMRTRRAYLQALEERTAQLEREQEANARRAAAEEQARIAREVHDVVAHNLSVIIVQATAADAVFVSDPDDARRAVRTIGRSARRALAELRHVLGSGDDQESVDLAPQPNLGRLDSLLDEVRLAGIEVELEREGPQRELDPALELSAYRIVQEALTNTLRHAGANRARVTLRFDLDALDLEIVDNGTATATADGNGGRGLIGMRERAATFGGYVEAGPDAAGGFRVTARLPIAAARH